MPKGTESTSNGGYTHDLMTNDSMTQWPMTNDLMTNDSMTNDQWLNDLMTNDQLTNVKFCPFQRNLGNKEIISPLWALITIETLLSRRTVGGNRREVAAHIFFTYQVSFIKPNRLYPFFPNFVAVVKQQLSSLTKLFDGLIVWWLHTRHWQLTI